MRKKAIFCCMVLSLALTQLSAGQVSDVPRSPVPLYVKVELDRTVKLSSLKPGDVTEGNLSRDVYAADRKVFPAGSHVWLTVDHMERTRRAANDRWPWVVKFFSPRHRNSPSFKDAAISVSDGSRSRLQVSLISAGARRELHAPAPKDSKSDTGATRNEATAVPVGESGQRATRGAGLVMSLEAHQEEGEKGSDTDMEQMAPIGPATLLAGTSLRILLLSAVSASKSHPGDMVEARLLEPVALESHVILPAGLIFEGTVLQVTPPRTLSRAGSLSLSFTGLKLPDGTRVPLSASLSGLEVNRGSHTRIDAEGRIHGERPGTAWMLINGGMTAGLAKVTDDSTQLILEGILSGATDASTAGTARIAGLAVSGVFLLSRHGRDVVLPDRTEMNIILNRPLTISSQLASASR